MLPDRFPSIPPNHFQKCHVLKVWRLDKQQMMPIFPPLISAISPILSSSNFAKKLLKVPICSVSVLVCNSVLALIQFRFIFDLYQIPFRFSFNLDLIQIRFIEVLHTLVTKVLSYFQTSHGAIFQPQLC